MHQKRLSRVFDDRYSDYFYWLGELVCVDGRYTDEAYWTLAKILFEIDFDWVLEMDGDRARNGIALRARYDREGGRDQYDGPCTVLEALIALSCDMADILDELDGEDKSPMFFWSMIDNLNLSYFTDLIFEENPDRYDRFLRRILKRVYAWMDRDIDYDGTGGIFPLREPRSDQRDVELWYQANAYIMENYWSV